MARVPVILHERRGRWIRHLRPRLNEPPIRWFETRSTADLEEVLIGLAYPVILIDLERQAAPGLKDLGRIAPRTPDGRILVINSEAQPDVPEWAYALGATHVFSGFVPPPVVAGLLARWIALARWDIAQAGWSRTDFPPTETDPWSWLEDRLDEPEGPGGKPGTASRWLSGPPATRSAESPGPTPPRSETTPRDSGCDSRG